MTRGTDEFDIHLLPRSDDKDKIIEITKQAVIRRKDVKDLLLGQFSEIQLEIEGKGFNEIDLGRVSMTSNSKENPDIKIKETEILSGSKMRLTVRVGRAAKEKMYTWILVVALLAAIVIFGAVCCTSGGLLGG